MYCEVPDVFEIDICIGMDQTVSHTCHFSPGDIGILCADLFRDVFCRLTHAIDSSHDVFRLFADVI